jgi:FkbM family methyltransferase
MRVRRAVGRVLPAPAKRFLRAVLPARLLQAHPVTRSFWLSMPGPPAGLGPAVRAAATPSRVRIEAPYLSYVPRLLEESGIRAYEPETVAAFLASVSTLEAGEVFDIGANVGIFSIIAATTTTAHVTGFEPTPQLAATYRTISGANQLTCEIEELALGARNGSATLYISAKTDSSNSLKAGFRPATGTVDVRVERLDEYVARTGRRPQVMKIDTETTEPDVLAGGSETLRTIRPWIICEVLAGKTEAPLDAILRPLGYRFHQLDSEGPPRERSKIVGDMTYRHRDWLFTPEPLPDGFSRHYAAWLDAIRAAG